MGERFVSSSVLGLFVRADFELLRRDRSACIALQDYLDLSRFVGLDAIDLTKCDLRDARMSNHRKSPSLFPSSTLA